MVPRLWRLAWLPRFAIPGCTRLPHLPQGPDVHGTGTLPGGGKERWPSSGRGASPPPPQPINTRAFCSAAHLPPAQRDPSAGVIDSSNQRWPAAGHARRALRWRSWDRVGHSFWLRFTASFSGSHSMWHGSSLSSPLWISIPLKLNRIVGFWGPVRVTLRHMLCLWASSVSSRESESTPFNPHFHISLPWFCLEFWKLQKLRTGCKDSRYTGDNQFGAGSALTTMPTWPSRSSLRSWQSPESTATPSGQSLPPQSQLSKVKHVWIHWWVPRCILHQVAYHCTCVNSRF